MRLSLAAAATAGAAAAVAAYRKGGGLPQGRAPALSASPSA